MFRRISLLTVDRLRPSSRAMARMLRRECKRSAIVFRSVSERNLAARDFFGLFVSTNYNFQFAQVLQRPLDAKPSQ